MVVSGVIIYEYEMPLVASMSGVWMEGSTPGVFDVEVPRRWWDVNREVSPRRLLLRKHVLGDRAWDPISGRVLKIVGQAYPAQLTADSNSVAIDPEYVLVRAASYLLDGLPAGQRSSYPDGNAWLRRAEQLEARAMSRPDPNSIEVEPQ